MDWEPRAKEKFQQVTSKIPVFHRHIAEEAVSKQAKKNAQLRGSIQIEEEDIIAAFFSDVPNPFYSMMVRLLEQNGFDYKKYGFPKTRINTDKNTDIHG
jgi:hypothetical protein